MLLTKIIVFCSIPHRPRPSISLCLPGNVTVFYINQLIMKILIESPKIVVRESLLEFVREKVGKLALFSDSLMEARVTLKLKKAEGKQQKVCEIRSVIPGNDLFTSKQGENFEEAVLKAVEAAKRQIKDWKGKAGAEAGVPIAP